MQYLALAMIATVMLVGYVTDDLGLGPSILKLLPEVFSAIALLGVVLIGVGQRFRFVRPAYWLAFGVLLIMLICGVVVNAMEPGPIVAGARTYLRAAPIFFIAAVFPFQDGHVRQQLRLLLVLAVVQVPVAIRQRLVVMGEGRFTGDSVAGTLVESGMVSLFLVCCVIVLTALFLRKRIGKVAYFSLFFLLLVPTMINETKATLVLLPIGLFVVFWAGSPPDKRLRVITLAVALLATFGGIFVAAYEFFNEGRQYYTPVTEFFTDPKKLESYLKTDAEVGSEKQAGRVDALTVPWNFIKNDPLQLVFGVGAGNGSVSVLGRQFTGEHGRKFEQVAITTGGMFLIEIGVAGSALLFLVYWLIFRDAVVVATRSSDLQSALALGWMGVIVVVVLASFYIPVHALESASYLFWYFSGLIAARRMRLLPQVRGHAVTRPATGFEGSSALLQPKSG